MNRKQIKSIAKQIENLERELETADNRRKAEIEAEIMTITQKIFREKDGFEIMAMIDEIVSENLTK